MSEHGEKPSKEHQIIIVLDSLEGHITHVFTSNPALDVKLVDIDIDTQDPVRGPYDPQVTIVVADVEAAARAHIKEKVPDYAPEEEGREHRDSSGEGQRGDLDKSTLETILLDLGNGYSLRCGYDETAEMAFLYGSDEKGSLVENGYWDYKELLEAGNSAPECVLGGLARAGVSPLDRQAVVQVVQGFLEDPPRAKNGQNEEAILAFLCPDNCPGISFPMDRWLWEADDKAISALRELSYGGNYLSDEIAQDVRAYDEKVSAVMAYCEATHSGFTCAVPIQAIEAWVRRHKPHLVADEPNIDTQHEG